MPTIFQWPARNSSKDSKASEADSFGSVMSAAGDELFESSYTQIAAAVDRLAEADPRLKRHLSWLGDAVRISLNVGFTSTPMSFDMVHPRRPQKVMESPGAIPKGVAEASCGDVLTLQSADELISAMSRPVAQGILQHKQEVVSWDVVNISTAPATVAALRFGGVRWSRSLLLGMGLWQAAHAVLHTWLPRQQEYEADQVAAAISSAAGCSPASILTSMQRAYCATKSQADWSQALHEKQSEIYLSALKGHLPSSITPTDFSQGSKSVLLMKHAAETSLVPGLREHLNFCIDKLEGLLAEELCALRNPIHAWTSPHAHLLDRIARLEKMLGKVEHAAASSSSSGSR